MHINLICVTLVCSAMATALVIDQKHSEVRLGAFSTNWYEADV